MGFLCGRHWYGRAERVVGSLLAMLSSISCCCSNPLAYIPPASELPTPALEAHHAVAPAATPPPPSCSAIASLKKEQPSAEVQFMPANLSSFK